MNEQKPSVLLDAPAASPRRRLRPRAVLRRKSALRTFGETFLGPKIQDRFLRLFGSPVFFQVLRTACELDLFGLLRRKPGLKLEQIAQALDLSDEAARVLLLNCLALRLVRRKGTGYLCHNRLLARQLDRDEPNNVWPVIEWMHHIVYPAAAHLTQSLKEGWPAGLQAFAGDEATLYGRLEHDPRLKQIFFDAMRFQNRISNERFLQVVDFSCFDRLLDVGGGDGEVLTAIARRHKRLHGTVLDLPATAATAQETIEQCGMTNRLGAIGSDFHVDEFPTGYDCVLFSRVNGNHSQEANRMLMRKAFAALDRGGMVCVYSAFMDDDESGPLRAAMMSAYFWCAVAEQGRLYSRREVAQWLKQAGFVDITSALVAINQGVVIGLKP